jgi:hypothetical protein
MEQDIGNFSARLKLYYSVISHADDGDAEVLYSELRQIALKVHLNAVEERKLSKQMQADFNQGKQDLANALISTGVSYPDDELAPLILLSIRELSCRRDCAGL